MKPRLSQGTPKATLLGRDKGPRPGAQPPLLPCVQAEARGTQREGSRGQGQAARIGDRRPRGAQPEASVHRSAGPQGPP